MRGTVFVPSTEMVDGLAARIKADAEEAAKKMGTGVSGLSFIVHGADGHVRVAFEKSGQGGDKPLMSISNGYNWKPYGHSGYDGIEDIARRVLIQAGLTEVPETPVPEHLAKMYESVQR